MCPEIPLPLSIQEYKAKSRHKTKEQISMIKVGDFFTATDWGGHYIGVVAKVCKDGKILANPWVRIKDRDVNKYSTNGSFYEKRDRVEICNPTVG